MNYAAKDGGVVFYDAVQHRKPHMAVFPIETEMRLINLATNRADPAFIHSDNGHIRGFTGYRSSALNQQMYLTILRISESLHVE